MRHLLFFFLFVPIISFAGDKQCRAIICLNTDFSGVTAECYKNRIPYFQQVVFNPLFDPISTSALRAKWLSRCHHANSSDVAKLNKKYGTLLLDPKY